MQPYQERAVAEANELRERFIRLTAFISGSDIFKALGAEDQELLRRQRAHMGDYLDVLDERVARF